MREHLFKDKDGKLSPAAATIPVNQWIYQPGLPASAPVPVSDAFQTVDHDIAMWTDGGEIATAEWSTQEWLHFLRGLPRQLNPAAMRRLDSSYHLTDSGNDEILDQWLLMAIRNHYKPAYPRLEEFLMTVGRRKYVKPLYEALDTQGGDRDLRESETDVPSDHAGDARLDPSGKADKVNESPLRLSGRAGTRSNGFQRPGDLRSSCPARRGESAIRGSR